jgi:hypothetical protein
VALAGVLLAGCTSGDGTPSQAAAQTPGSAAAGNAAGAGTPSTAASAPAGSSGAGVEAADQAKVVAEQTVKVPKFSDSTVTIGVQALEVRGPVMVLRLLVTPKFSAAALQSRTSVNLFRALSETNFRPTLIDPEHLKVYSPLGGYSPWASDLQTASANGTPMLAWAYFAAPQDGISAVDVRVADFVPAFTRVPIAK